jgi:hypothetical protein
MSDFLLRDVQRSLIFKHHGKITKLLKFLDPYKWVLTALFIFGFVGTCMNIIHIVGQWTVVCVIIISLVISCYAGVLRLLADLKVTDLALKHHTDEYTVRKLAIELHDN